MTNVIEENLENGNYILIVVMDHIPDEFKHIMDFISIKEGFKVYALEVKEYFKSEKEGNRILEIELYGRTERKARSTRVYWTLEDVKRSLLWLPLSPSALILYDVVISFFQKHDYARYSHLYKAFEFIIAP